MAWLLSSFVAVATTLSRSEAGLGKIVLLSSFFRYLFVKKCSST